MGRVEGRIIEVERHPAGRWDRITLDTGKVVYMRRVQVEMLEKEFGSDTPPVRFRFEINTFWNQVQRIDALESNEPRDIQIHRAFGGRIDQIRQELAAKGSQSIAAVLDVEQYVSGSRAQGGCMHPSPHPIHVIIHCVLEGGHEGSHSGRCMACDLTVGVSKEAEARRG